MAGGGEVPAGKVIRLVRCPKCHRLLPEFAGFRVYRCGGCDAPLQANQATTTIMDKTDDEKSNVAEVPENPPSRMEDYSSATPEAALESNEMVFPGHNGDALTNISISSGTDSRPCGEASNRPDESEGSDVNAEGLVESEEGLYQHPSETPVSVVCTRVGELHKVDGQYRGKEVRAQEECEGQKIRKTTEHKDKDEHVSSFQRKMRRSYSQGVRFSPYSDEGPSNYQPISTNRCSDINESKLQNQDFPDRAQLIEHDRVELIRQLDELRDQLSLSCKITERQKAKATMTNREAPINPCQPPSRTGMSPEVPSLLDQSSAWKMPSPRECESFREHDRSLGYGELFGPRMHREIPYNSSYNYPQRTSEGYLYGQFDPHLSRSCPRDYYGHQPVCPCPDCWNKHRQMPSSTMFGSRRLPYPAHGHLLYPLDTCTILDSRVCNQRHNSTLHSHNPRTHFRPIRQFGRCCHPLEGGAPFIICFRCFQLLQVPEELLLTGKSRNKLQCGSCSQVISFEIKGKHVTVLLEPQNEDEMTDLQHTVRKKRTTGGSDHGDYDEKFILPDSPSFLFVDSALMEKDCRFSLSGSDNMEESSSFSSASKGGSTDATLSQGVAFTSIKPSLTSNQNPRAPSVALRDHFGYVSSDHVANRSISRSRSACSEEEKVLITVNGNFKQNSVKDVLMASEMDSPVDVNPISGSRKESMDTSNDEHKVNKGGDSFFGGLLKRSFRDSSSRSNQRLENRKCKVSINGQPISDRLVKKAEKRAGPIQPGEYWYDYQAGFWGVMGQPGAGIIPPFIDELNYPMLKNCAGGDTGVCVNGRELHEKDLDLLAGRGLPTSRDRSYIIHISGEVLDAISGEELDCLGKLAPTVEKVKHGFGMWASNLVGS